MKNSLQKISRALLDLATHADVIMRTTSKARAVQKSPKLDGTQKSLLERIDGFRSLEQLLAMSGDLIAVHAALGKLIAAGLVSTDAADEDEDAVPTNVTSRPAVAIPVAPPVPEKRPFNELDDAKRLLLAEAKLALGKGAEKLRPRIDACRSTEEIFDLIVKVQEHLTTSGKADPDVFLDRLTNGLAMARKAAPAGKRAPAK